MFAIAGCCASGDDRRATRAVLTGTASQPGELGRQVRRSPVDEPHVRRPERHESRTVPRRRVRDHVRAVPPIDARRHRRVPPDPGRRADGARRLGGRRAPRQHLRDRRRSSSSTARCSGSRRPCASRRSAITGTTATAPRAIRTTKGGTWAALGLREFDADPDQPHLPGRGRVHDPPHDRLPRRVPLRRVRLPPDRRRHQPARQRPAHHGRRREDRARRARLRRRSVRSRLLIERRPRIRASREQQ